MIENKLLEKIHKARFHLSWENPFLAVLISKYELIIDPTGEITNTAAIDLKEKKIYINQNLAEVLDLDELIWILGHESVHILQFAKEREKVVGKDRETWNVAQDFADNLILEDFHVGRMPEIWFDPETRRFNKEGIGSEVKFPYSEQFRGWTSEEIYKYIKKFGQKMTLEGVEFLKIPFPESVPTPSGGVEIVPGEEEIVIVFDDVQNVPATSKEFDELVDEVVKSWNIARRPDAWARYIEEILHPEIPWHALLLRYIRQVSKSDYQWVPPSKKTWATGIYLPGLRGEKLKIVIAIDSSGSITKEEFMYFVSETMAILKTFPEIEAWVVVCDDLVRGYQKIIVPYQKVDSEIFKGYGGTDYNPVFEFVKINNIRPDVLVYFTDLICGAECFPRYTPQYPVIWVCTQPPEIAYKPPFGEIIWYRRKKF